MKTKKPETQPKKKKKDNSSIRNIHADHSKAFGDKGTICINTDCVLRKKSHCFGFEGCPGFKSR